jgi:hypothetical protein
MKKLTLIFLGLTVFAILFSSCNPVNKLGQNPEVKKWEGEVTGLEALPVSESNNTILFIGSSSVRLWDSVSTDMLPYQAIARGYGGAKLSDFVYYTNRIVSPHQAGAIALFIANDITGDEVNDISPEEVLSLFRLTVRQIRKSHPDVPVFWIEVTPTPSRWKSWPQISKANKLISEYCEKKENIIFLQTSHKFLNDKGLPDTSLFLSDMLHLNREGYQLWSECIKVGLKNAGIEIQQK